MAIPHGAPAHPIDIRPLADQLGDHRTTTLLKTDSLEVIRLVLPSGKSIPSHQAAGDLTLQCIEGSVVLSVDDSEVELRAGYLTYLEGSTPHALRALEPSSVLLTLRITSKKNGESRS